MAKKGGRRGKGSRPRRPRQMSDVDVRVIGHTNMVLDPCHSTITQTAYRGQDGFVQRFAKTNTLSLTTEQTFIYIFYPAYNSIYQAAVATPSTAIGPITYSLAGPGQPFLLANADAQRTVAACAEIDYTGTELNRQGLLYMGVVKASIFGDAVTVDQITALVGHPVRVPDKTASVKWMPAPADEEYWRTGAGQPEAFGDRNVMVIVGTGFTSAVAFQLTSTLIAEWQPSQGLGIAATNPNTADAPAGMELVRTNLAEAGNFWVSTAQGAERAYQIGRKAYYTGKAMYNATGGLRRGMAALALTM